MKTGMGAAIITVDETRPEEAFSRCRDVVRQGGVIVYPTETFYGLGADPCNPAAVRKLFAVKGRKPDRPILLLIRDAADVRRWAAEVPADAERLMQAFWPGPLTLVFKARPEVLPELTAGTGTIGLRVPGSDFTRRLLGCIGTALTGTSANLSGGRSPETAHEAAEVLGGRVDLILDGGRTPGGRPSTVVDVSTVPPRMVREGVLPLKELRSVLPALRERQE